MLYPGLTLLDLVGPLQVLPACGSSTTVDIPARTVTVSYDEASVGRGELIGAIEQQGYEVPAR